MPIAKLFYPRFSYGSGPTVYDFVRPVTPRIAPGFTQGRNLATGGASETLTERTETQLVLSFTRLALADVNALLTWFNSHAGLGKQTAITLDRLATCGGQWEYDNYNAFFTKAELLTNPFTPARDVLGAARFAIDLTFRQGV